MNEFFKKKYSKETEIGKTYGHIKILDFIEHHVVNGKKVRARAIVTCLNCNSEPYEMAFQALVKACRSPTRSCGCLNPGRTSHGMKHHLYYNSCNSAIARCRPDSGSHEYYYDRGIRCFWTMKTIGDFIKYLEANLPPRKPEESLDRIDNNKGYQPGNLRWATPLEQTLNQRKHITNHQFDQLKKENRLLKKKINKLKRQLRKNVKFRWWGR